jgi:large subunit ribosomal protein L19
MADLMRQIEQEYSKQNVPDFRPGDTVRVGVNITEGSGDDQRSRVQPYEGVVLGRSGSGLNETFTVRRVTHGVGVERTFPVHSPAVVNIEVVRRGNPRRAKLYYLRERVGRGARVRARADAWDSQDDAQQQAEAQAQAQDQAQAQEPDTADTE